MVEKPQPRLLCIGYLSLHLHVVPRPRAVLKVAAFANFHRRQSPTSIRDRHGVIGTVETETLTAGTTMMFRFRRLKHVITAMALLGWGNDQFHICKNAQVTSLPSSRFKMCSHCLFPVVATSC